MLDLNALCQCVAAPVAESRLETIKTVAAIAAFPGALLTFALGYRQKEKERTLAYYHKVVTDFAVPSIFPFFSDQVQALSAAGRDSLESVNSDRKTLPRSATIALASFSTQLFNLQNSITDRTIIFDEPITSKIALAFQNIQDETSIWFNDISMFKRRNVEELSGILRRGQRCILALIYKGQFKNF